MKLLDRSKPMRAVHRGTGEIGTAKAWHGADTIIVRSDLGTWASHFDGYGNPKDDYFPWRVENAPTYTEEVMELGRANSIEKSYTGPQSNTIPVDTALFERMVALVRNVATGWDAISTSAAVTEARAIAELLPPVTDPDLIEARALVAECCKWFTGNSKQAGKMVSSIISGEWDDARSGLVRSAFDKIKRGRELERGE